MFWQDDFVKYDIWRDTLADAHLEWPELRKYNFTKKMCQETWPTRKGYDNEKEPYGKPFPFYQMQGTFESYEAVQDFKYRQEWRKFFETVLNLPLKEPLTHLKSIEEIEAEHEQLVNNQQAAVDKEMEEVRKKFVSS